MPAPHHTVFYRPDALPAAQPTASKHWRQKVCNKRCLVFSLVLVCYIASQRWDTVTRWSGKICSRVTANISDYHSQTTVAPRITATMLGILSWDGGTLYLSPQQVSGLILYSETNVWDLISMHNVINHVCRPVVPSHWQTQKTNEICSVQSVAVMTLPCKLRRHSRCICFVYICLVRVEVFWFDSLISDQSLPLLHILHVNYWSPTTVWDFGLSER